MQFSLALLFSGLLAGAAAQSSNSNTSPAQASQANCLAQCNPADNNCRSACLVGPSANPNNVQANQTTACAASCNQGSGSPSENSAYGQCLAACIQSYYQFSTTGPGPTMSSPTNTGMGLSMSTGTGTFMTGTGMTMGTGTGMSMSTGTGLSTGSMTMMTPSSSGMVTAQSATATPTSKNAADGFKVGGPLLGLAGIIGALAAL